MEESEYIIKIQKLEAIIYKIHNKIELNKPEKEIVKKIVNGVD